MSTESSLRSYDHVAGFYDVMSDVYSFGQIRAAKLDQVRFMKQGDRVLFVGCGSGVDVLAAVRLGCDVTAVDTSSKMIAKLRHRLERKSLSATLVCDRYQNIDSGPFDVVCSNFFMNCFPHETMETMLREQTALVQDGGKMMIADVAPPAGNVFSRTANRVYLHGAMLPFWMMGLVHWHPNHNYVETLNRLGWEAEVANSFRMLRLGPVAFRNIVATRH